MLHHVAICQKNKEKSKEFFAKILGLEIEKEFVLDKKLAKDIFSIPEEYELEVIHYKNETLMIEVFISEKYFSAGVLEHICLFCENHLKIIEKCKENNFNYTYIRRENLPNLLFIYDFDNNRYEFFEED